MKRVVIIGAGMAGLSAAYYLEKGARDAGIPLRCTLLEPNAWLGGKVRTEVHDGSVIATRRRTWPVRDGRRRRRRSHSSQML